MFGDGLCDGRGESGCIVAIIDIEDFVQRSSDERKIDNAVGGRVLGMGVENAVMKPVIDVIREDALAKERKKPFVESLIGSCAETGDGLPEKGGLDMVSLCQTLDQFFRILVALPYGGTDSFVEGGQFFGRTEFMAGLENVFYGGVAQVGVFFLLGEDGDFVVKKIRVKFLALNPRRNGVVDQRSEIRHPPPSFFGLKEVVEQCDQIVIPKSELGVVKTVEKDRVIGDVSILDEMHEEHEFVTRVIAPSPEVVDFDVGIRFSEDFAQPGGDGFMVCDACAECRGSTEDKDVGFFWIGRPYLKFSIGAETVGGDIEGFGAAGMCAEDSVRQDVSAKGMAVVFQEAVEGLGGMSRISGEKIFELHPSHLQRAEDMMAS